MQEARTRKRQLDQIVLWPTVLFASRFRVLNCGSLLVIGTTASIEVTSFTPTI
jgi:hypothetical protein